MPVIVNQGNFAEAMLLLFYVCKRTEYNSHCFSSRDLQFEMWGMSKAQDAYFNSNAYKLFRPKEYSMFLNYFKNKYSFSLVYDWVKLLYNENSLISLVGEHKEINAQLRRDIEEMKSTTEERDKGLTDAGTAIDLLNRKIVLLTELVTINEKGFNSAIDVLYRLRSSSMLFNTSDLRVLTPFSLFELVDDYHLYRHCEEGTTETPAYIDSNDPRFTHYSSVKLISSSKTIEYATSDREGRTVASYWIELPSDRVYIYNFHYDSTSVNRIVHNPGGGRVGYVCKILNSCPLSLTC
jgi:hypothetical protein